MTPTRVDAVNIFENGSLIVGTGGASVEKIIDPETPTVRIEHADQFHGDRPKVIPLRSNPNGTPSDITVKGELGRRALFGFDAKAAHYARYGGNIRVFRTDANPNPQTSRDQLEKVYTVSEYTDGAFIVHFQIPADAAPEQAKQMKRVQHRFDTKQGIGIIWGEVKPAFDERKYPSWEIEFGNVEGADALMLSGQVGALQEVKYDVILDAVTEDNAAAGNFDQHALSAQLVPKLTITNRTETDFSHMGLAVRLNDDNDNRSYDKRAARSLAFSPPGLEFASPQIDEASESDISGTITLPISAPGQFSLGKGETRVVNMSAAVITAPQTPRWIFKAGQGC
ncbi:MAG: hypothetical protein R3C68_05195 [Myxococcota bacterium]